MVRQLCVRRSMRRGISCHLIFSFSRNEYKKPHHPPQLLQSPLAYPLPPPKPKTHNPKHPDSNTPLKIAMHNLNTATHNSSASPSAPPPPYQPPCHARHSTATTPPTPPEPTLSRLEKLERLEETLRAYIPVCERLFDWGLKAGSMLVFGVAIGTLVVLSVGIALFLLSFLLYQAWKMVVG